MPHVSDAEMLRSLMDENGVSQADVVRGAGISKTVLSLVLNGKRDLTREHIEALSKYFRREPGRVPRVGLIGRRPATSPRVDVEICPLPPNSLAYRRGFLEDGSLSDPGRGPVPLACARGMG